MQPAQVVDYTELNINAFLLWVVSGVEGHSLERDDLESTWWQNLEFLQTVVWFKTQCANPVSLTSSVREIDCVVRAMHVE